MTAVILIILGVATVSISAIAYRKELATFFQEVRDKGRSRKNRKSEKVPRSWTARAKKDVFQGVDLLPLPLDDKALKTLSFKVKSKDEYWRAGFKLLLARSVWYSATLVNPDSILIHVGRNLDGSHIVCGYQNQHSKQSAPNQKLPEAVLPSTLLPWVKKGRWIQMTAQIDLYDLVISLDDGRFEHVFPGIKSDMDKQAFLVAWADHEDAAETIPRDYKIKFKHVRYTTR
jgi:hypothetical protein